MRKKIHISFRFREAPITSLAGETLRHSIESSCRKVLGDAGSAMFSFSILDVDQDHKDKAHVNVTLEVEAGKKETISRFVFSLGELRALENNRVTTTVNSVSDT
jgi:RNase P/RNase MRP subunit POP5